MAQMLFANMVLMEHREELLILQASRPLDFKGSIHDRFVKVLKGAATFTLVKYCESANHEERRFEQADFTIKIDELTRDEIPLCITNQVLSPASRPCRKCSTRTFQGVEQRSAHPAKLMFFNVQGESSFKWDALLKLEKEIRVGGERYTKAFTSLCVPGTTAHFIQIFDWGSETTVYDGIGCGSNGVYCKFEKYNFPYNTTVQNVTYIHRPFIDLEDLSHLITAINDTNSIHVMSIYSDCLSSL